MQLVKSPNYYMVGIKLFSIVCLDLKILKNIKLNVLLQMNF